MEKTFIILDADGKEVDYSTLNQQAAKLWNKEIEEGKYAYPHSINTTLSPEEQQAAKEKLEEYWTWKSVMDSTVQGWDKPTIGWENVIRGMIFLEIGEIFVDFSSPEDGYKLTEFVTANGETHLPVDTERALFYMFEHYRPYIELIGLWSSLGYCVQIL